MKKIILPLSMLSLTALLVAMQYDKDQTIETFHFKPQNAGGAGTGKTGAPGEQNCTGCHSGTAQDGSNENNLTILDDGSTPVTTYIPGAQYTVNLAMNSNPIKKGFQATALSSTNVMAGGFTAQAGNTSINGTTRKYANHTSASNTNTSAPIWSWTWTAPTTNVGDVTFYVASNKTNNNGNDNGDVIYLSQHTLSAQSSSSLQEQKTSKISIRFNSELNQVIADFSSLNVSKMSFNLTDLSGKSVFTSTLGFSQIGVNQQSIKLPFGLNSGVYMATFFIGNTPLSAKVYIP
ncbi:MAG: hypothetical protein K9G31_05155 [Crocinitomicaceae bacterium]|nr:hypothetical protein [Crocinitomicaceae bacterium]MCF8445142.1 hypothetical protein [Crocinitomicaceae bacterium]